MSVVAISDCDSLYYNNRRWSEVDINDTLNVSTKGTFIMLTPELMTFLL